MSSSFDRPYRAAGTTVTIQYEFRVPSGSALSTTSGIAPSSSRYQSNTARFFATISSRRSICASPSAACMLDILYLKPTSRLRKRTSPGARP